MKVCGEDYAGIEVGPIRPPSEAGSLLIRLTRNCPWNQCKFCGLYKGQKFSARPVEHIKKDIDQIRALINRLQACDGEWDSKQLQEENTSWIYPMVRDWYHNGMRSIFLQDANSLVIKPVDMIEILRYIKRNFPQVERITVYGRSHTIARISDEHLVAFAEAGLNRIHIGLETGSSRVLALVKKGVDKETHILAGQKVKRAGIELSEYYMPGLGGNEYSDESATETADALNKINPDFIRIRTLAVPENVELNVDYKNGLFTRTNDITTVRELLTFVANLSGITSYLKSDHILNLLEEVEGKFPEDKENMIAVLETFLALPEREQMIFRIGRRTGVMRKLDDLNNENRRNHAKQVIARYDINPENVDSVCNDLLKRFI